jgi:hypothetical protein
VLTYSWDQPAVAVDGKAQDMMIRAQNGGLQLIGAQMTRPRTLHGLDDILRQRRKFARRRKSRSRHQRDLAPGARGHGRRRALRHYRAVDDAQQRWTRSVCQQIAAKATRHAIRVGARWVVVDDHSVATALPPAALRTAVEWALTRAGLSRATKASSATAEKDAGGSP